MKSVRENDRQERDPERPGPDRGEGRRGPETAFLRGGGGRRSTLLNHRRIARREQDADGVRGLGVDLSRGQQGVVDRVAVRVDPVELDLVRDGDGHVEDGVVVLPVEPEVLPDGDLFFFFTRGKC